MQSFTVIAPEILIAIPQPHRRAAVRAVHRTTITAEAFHTQDRISPLWGSPYCIAGRTWFRLLTPPHLWEQTFGSSSCSATSEPSPRLRPIPHRLLPRRPVCSRRSEATLLPRIA